MKKTAKPKVSGYRLGKEIGRGGISVVYSVTMARLVAVLREGKYRRDRSRFRTYLAALVHNCCIDQMRAAARRREVPIDSVNLDDISAERDGRDTFSHLDRQWAEACCSAARRHVLEHVPLDPLHKKIFLESE